MTGGPIRQAIVLTAGLGTRLLPLTDTRAKPAISVCGEPLIRRILRWLAASGVTETVLNLHHRPETLTATVGDGSDLGLRVRYSWEPVILGSAGGPRQAVGLFGDDTFLIVNGDTLTDVDVAAMASDHARSGALVTMAVIPNPDPARYGAVRVAERGDATGFAGPVRDTSAAASSGALRPRTLNRTQSREPGTEPRTGRQEPGASPLPSLHFVGVQVAHRSAFDRLAPGTPAQSLGGLYDQLIAQRPGSVRAFVCGAHFKDIGAPADYLAASLQVCSEEGRPELPIGAGTIVEPGARLVRTVTWEHAHVGTNAELVDCIVGDHVRIPQGMHLQRAVIVRAASHRPTPGSRIEDELLIAPMDPVA